MNPHAETKLLEPRTLGRILGLTMLLEFAFEIVSNFAWQERLFDGAGLLARAATMRPLIGSATAVDLISAIVGIALGAALMLRYQAQPPVTARVYVWLSVALLAAAMTEDATLFAMGQLGADLQSPGNAGLVDSAALEHVLRALRFGIHLPVKLLGGFTLAIFFILLGRAGAIPRALSIAGVATSALQMATIGMGVFGLPLQLALLAPLALVYPVAGLWLLWRGLAR